MDLKQLEYFVCVVEQRSFTRAAIVLDIAQPALSRQVRLLELEFGQNLLLRNGRGVTATDAGNVLLEYGRGILHQVERLREEMGRSRGALIGSVALGLPPSLLRLLAATIFREFKNRMPAATLAIREGLSTSMQESLISGRLDMALVYNATPSPDIDLEPLIDEELLLVSPNHGASHAATLPQSIKVTDLPGFPLIMPSRPNAIRMLIEGELADKGLRPTIAFEVDGVGAILDLVAEGFGHAVLPRSAVGHLAQSPDLTLRSMDAKGLSTKLSLAINSHRQVTATQQALIELVRSVVRDHLAPEAKTGLDKGTP
ncbi:nitrogen assimilation transcriptional regulator NAC [Denitratisoma sp. agr-D3]